MSYYVVYPKNHSQKVKIVTKKPQKTTGYGHADGPIKNKCEVIRWLNWKDVSSERRPEGFKNFNLAEVCG